MPLVKLFGNLRQQSASPALNVPGVTVRGILETLCVGNAALCEMIFDGDVLQAHVQVMVNGRHIDLLQGLDTPVGEADHIAIFPPIAGG